MGTERKLRNPVVPVEMFGARWFATFALSVLSSGRLIVEAYISYNQNSHYKEHLKIPSIPPVYYPLRAYSDPKWPTTFNSHKTGAASRLEEAEPGFDFTEDEMEKLKIWPGGVIPYYIDDFSFDKVLRDRIRSFLYATNGVTGLNFLELHRPPDDEKTRWVLFVNRQGLLGCVDHPFKNFTTEGVQKVVLGYDCLNDGGELAEIILALVGVPPQHNAPDRSKYIQIVMENIIPGKEYLFEAMPDNEWLFHEVDYDFTSASHYPLHKYTVNGKATIKPLGTSDLAIREENGFSYTDIWKIRMLYNYISKKRRNSVNIPQCKKLFDIGSNSKNYVAYSEDDIVPRKKPNRYLGLPEDVPESIKSSKENIKPKKEGSKESFIVPDANSPKKLAIVIGNDIERKFTKPGGFVQTTASKSDVD